MQSKTSFFNPTVFKKNMTRFAPAWGLYTLCLVLGIVLIYYNGGSARQFHFASNLADLIQVMSVVNLIYAPLTAMLLFGDLYNSRMCNALHAMPIRRECWLVTNAVSGLVFSLIPSAVMTIIAIPLLANSYFANAWQIPLYVFTGMNLEFICFFGMAVFCALCVGNRFSMAVLYGLINFGASIAYWLIDTLYRPMLYGVVTPSRLVENLTPVAKFIDYTFIETGSLYHLRELFGEELKNAVANFSLTENWNYLFVWAAVGLGFLVLALVLYRKRNLECAGDAMAFKVLEPVFQILCAVLTAAGSQFFISEFLGFRGEYYYYIFLLAGLVVGWFACRMLIERSSRVFRIKNWYGLIGLTAALALSLFLTHLDILGISSWMPRVEDVKSVTLSHNYELTDKADIQKILNLQAEALDTRLEDNGAYVQNENGQWVRFLGIETSEDMDKWDDFDSRYAFYANITYTLENGKEVTRRYYVWSDGQAGDDMRQILSRWEFVNDNNDTVYVNGRETKVSVLDEVLDTLEGLYIEGIDEKYIDIDRAAAEQLVAAMKADCDAGHLAQSRYLHRGHFRKPSPEEEGGYYYRSYLQVNLVGDNYSWYMDIYPECENTLKWLREHDLLKYNVIENTLCFY